MGFKSRIDRKRSGYKELRDNQKNKTPRDTSGLRKSPLGSGKDIVEKFVMPAALSSGGGLSDTSKVLTRSIKRGKDVFTKGTKVAQKVDKISKTMQSKAGGIAGNIIKKAGKAVVGSPKVLKGASIVGGIGAGSYGLKKALSGEEVKSDTEKLLEAADKKKSDDLKVGGFTPWSADGEGTGGVQTNFTDPTPPVTQEENKISGANQIKDPDKQPKRDAQQNGGKDASSNYNPNIKNVSTSNNSNTASVTGSTSNNQGQSIPGKDTNASQTLVQDDVFTTNGGENINYDNKTSEDKIKQFTDQLQTEYQGMIDEGYSEEEARSYVNNRMEVANANIAELGYDPLPTPDFSNIKSTDENYQEIESVKKPVNENYMGAAGQQMSSIIKTQDERYQQEMNSLGMPDYIFNQSTGNYEIKRPIEVKSADTGKANSLINSFQQNKASGSGAGMAQEFGINMADLNQFVTNVTNDFGSAVPEGVAKMNELINGINQAQSNGEVGRAQDLLAQLKIFSGQVSDLVVKNMGASVGWQRDMLNDNSMYQLAKKVQNGAIRVKRYYDKGYSDILAEAKGIATPQYKIGYVDIDSASTQKKAMLRNDPAYKQFMDTYAKSNSVVYGQLTADLYGSSSMTSHEEDFVRWINDKVYKPMRDSYKTLKKSMSAAEAKAMLPGYDDISNLVNLMYRTQFDDHLDALTVGMNTPTNMIRQGGSILRQSPIQYSNVSSASGSFNPMSFNGIE